MKRKYLIYIGLILVLMTSLSVSAGNDGNALADPFGDCGAAVSFGGDAKYYDFLMPYNLTFADIGGYAKAVTFDPGSAYAGWDMVTDATDAAKRVGTFNRQGSKSGTWLGYTVKVDSNTGFQYVEKDGIQFYIATPPKAPFNYSAVVSGGFYQYSMLAATGVIYDVILKDGTVIHFATGDGMGARHMNNPASESVYSGGQDGVNIQFAELKLPQYNNLFHASPPNHSFECFCESGALSRFKSYYNIGDSNPVVAIRMWNKCIKEGTIVANTGMSGLSSKGSAISGTVNPVGGTNPGTSGGLLANPQYVTGTYAELDMKIYQALIEPNLEDTLLAAADRDNLRQNELEGLTDWTRNNQLEKEEHGFIATLRWVVVLIGIVITIWALLVYLAFWFDHINSFVYLDALHIITFGQLHICAPGDKPTFSLGKKVQTKTVSHIQIIGICAMAILFGSLLISGLFYTVVSRLVNLILGFFK